MQSNPNEKAEKSRSNVRAVKRNNILFALILIALGINFIVFPKESQDMLIKIVCVICILSALISLFFSFMAQKTLAIYVSMLGAIVVTVGAIFLFLNPEVVYTFINIVFGIFILFNGVYQLLQSFAYARRIGSFVFSVITILLGVIVTMKPEAIMVFNSQFAGIAMIVAGAAFIWLFWHAKANYEYVVIEENGTVDIEPVVAEEDAVEIEEPENDDK